jgi:sulfite exporter TauE/SafE/copper chaperone CopZ
MGSRPRVSGTSQPSRHSGDALADDYAPERDDGDDSGFTTIVPVLGMTCRACEQRIGRQVGKLRYVESVAASAARGRVVIESSQPLTYRALERAIRLAGYEIGETPWLARDSGVWLTAVAGLGLVVALAVIAQVTGIASLASGVGDLSSGGLVVAALLGLAAGVSTCMALVGGLLLALSASFQASSTAPRTGLAAMRPAAIFVAGRIVGYGLFGAALGAVGATIQMPPLVTAALMIGVAVVMLVLGTRLTGLSPRIAGWSPTLPMGLSRSLGIGNGNAAAYSDVRAAGLGAASFFLPCGFTQAVQIFALSTGSPLFGGALLATFAIGTAPGLLALAGVPLVVPSGARPTLLRLVGAVVLAFALVNVTAGLQLAGISLPAFGVGSVAAAPSSTLTADGRQLLTTYQLADGYSPTNVTIYAGIPTVWTVESKTVTTCAATLVIPAWDTGVQLKLGPNELQLPALDAGVVHYTCAMGMYSGTITVVDRPAGTQGTGTGS